MSNNLDMQAVDFKDISNTIHSGDLIVFGGNDPASELVKLITRSPVCSIGLVLNTKLVINLQYDTNSKTDDSTMLNRPNQFNLVAETSAYNRVDISRLKTRLDECSGEVWYLPLKSDIRKKIETRLDLQQIIKNFENRDKAPDDTVTEALVKTLDDANPGVKTALSRLYGATLFATLLNEVHLLGNSIEVDQLNTHDICKMSLFKANYHQLQGNYKVKIPGFNSNNEMVYCAN